jgi:hypothetical protein
MEPNSANIKPADLFFTTSDSIFSWIVRQRTWGRFSHVQIITGVKEAEPLGPAGTKNDHPVVSVISADSNGVYWRDVDEEEWLHYSILTYPQMTEKERQDVCKFCFSQIGKPYDFMGLASFLLYKEFQNDDRWFCSELAYVAYKQAGIRLQRRVKKDFISPRDLYISPLLKPVAGNAEYDWI